MKMATNRYTDGTYLEKVKDWHLSDSHWKASKVFQMIEKNHLEFNSICDVGCGAGQILVDLQEKLKANVSLAGFDISPQAIEIAKPKENARLKFYNEDFLASDAASPDVLLLLDVFEHIPDYLGFLERLRKKSDWIVFHIPLDFCARSVLRKSYYMLYMRENFGHLHYFSKETALATLSDLGYDIIDYFFTVDDEIGGIRAQKGMREKIQYVIRKNLFRIKPDFTAAIFTHFNLMVLARGDRKNNGEALPG
jgi:SAM-dependent methyltransferase